MQFIYDAWGNFEITNVNNSTVVDNPLTYRGYVYDHGTGLYYLQSRYYDPNTGRFLNADAFTSTGQGFAGNNMFAYCGNNPVLFKDPHGESTTTVDPELAWWIWLLGLADGPLPVADAVVIGICCLFGFTKTSNKGLVQNPQDNKLDSDDVNWEKSNDNDKNHIIKGTKDKHVPGWKEMGIDANSRNAWGKILPFLKEVIDSGQYHGARIVSGGIAMFYSLYYPEYDVNLVVKIYIDFQDKLPRISDAIPFTDPLAYIKYLLG